MGENKERMLNVGTCLVIFAAGHLCAVQAWGLSPKDLFAAQTEHFKRLHALDITVTREQIRAPGRQAEPRERFVYRFQLEGRKFRAETGLHWLVPPIGTISDIHTFDGATCRILSKTTLHLNVRDRAILDGYSYGVSPAVLRPYFFLFSGVGEATFEAVRDAGRWATLAQRATAHGSAMVGEYECVRVDIPTGRQGERITALERVYFAGDLGSYPLRTEHLDEEGALLSRLTVTKPLRVATPAGDIIIPLEMTGVSYDANGQVQWTYAYSIDRERLSVNEDIPDEVFDISLTHAAEYSEGKTRSNSFYLDGLTVTTSPLARASLGNSLRKETGVWVQPPSVCFGTVAGEAPPARRMLEIMPEKTHLERRLTRAYSGDKGWLSEEMENTEALPPEALEKITVESTRPYLALRTQCSSESLTVRVTLREDAPTGLLRENLLVRLNDPADHTIRVPVMAEVRGRYQAAPSGLFFGSPALGEEVVRSCRVGPLHENDALEIVSPQAAGGDWLDVAIGRAGDSALLDVRYKHAPPLDNVAGALTLRIRPEGADQGRLLQIPLLSEWDPRAATSHVMVGDVAPDFSYTTLTGSKGKLSDLRGKVVLVNLFATWCGPCRDELPRLEKDVMATFPSEKFALICVGIGHGIAEIKEFRTKNSFNVPMVEDPQKKIHDAFVETTGIPRNYVIDPAGRIVYQASGYSEQRFNRMLEVIERFVRKVPANGSAR